MKLVVEMLQLLQFTVTLKKEGKYELMKLLKQINEISKQIT